jgi:hypothetical protein
MLNYTFHTVMTKLQFKLGMRNNWTVYNNNNNNLLTASGLSPGGSGYFTFNLRQTY